MDQLVERWHSHADLPIRQHKNKIFKMSRAFKLNTEKICTPWKSTYWSENEMNLCEKSNMAFTLKHFGILVAGL